MMGRPIIIIGAGGHAKVVINLAQLLGYEILFATDIDTKLHGTKIVGIDIIGDDSHIAAYAPSKAYLANGIGIKNNTATRRNVFEKWAASGYKFPSLVHPSAVIAETVIIEDGVQCMAGSIVQSDARLGKNSVVNTSASLDHDTNVGDHSFIGPGVVTGGNVIIDACAFIGTGAIITPNISIGENAIVGAGSTVIKNLSQHSKAVGNPARLIENKT